MLRLFLCTVCLEVFRTRRYWPLSGEAEVHAPDLIGYHMHRFGESYRQLCRPVVRLGETFDSKTLPSWIEGDRVPRSVASVDILSRIERQYRLPAGYFKGKLPHQTRSLRGHDLGDIAPAERRRLAWHLPDDFSSLAFSKREEILDWVRRVIISGSTDYRRYQAAASKQRYAIRFPGVTYGGGALSPRATTLAAGHRVDLLRERQRDMRGQYSRLGGHICHPLSD